MSMKKVKNVKNSVCDHCEPWPMSQVQNNKSESMNTLYFLTLTGNANLSHSIIWTTDEGIWSAPLVSTASFKQSMVRLQICISIARSLQFNPAVSLVCIWQNLEISIDIRIAHSDQKTILSLLDFPDTCISQAPLQSSVEPSCKWFFSISV